MPQIINTNIASLNAQRNLDRSKSANSTALQRLSSGLRINSAKDDAAGLAISTRFTSQIKGLNVAVRNAGDGIALAQTAEGALGSMNDNLQRIRELAVQSANATNSDVDRDALQSEVKQLLAEVSRTAKETDFNGRNLLDGSFSATFQVGANAGQTIGVSIAELTVDRLGSSAQSGLSARGTDNALGNGDLTINGVAVAASKAEDDTSSTSNNAASAISKVAAINRYTEQTGVKAEVNKNVASGSEISELAGTGKFKLNGVEVSFSTTNDAAQTRASIAEAINAFSGQTGIKAVDSKSAAGGVDLVAEDGRNIQLSFDVTDLSAAFTGTDAEKAAKFASATGLPAGATLSSGTTFSNTYEGGYTLIAAGDQKTIDVAGGNGTGRGDVANSGLTVGTYNRGVATTVSSEKADTTTAAAVGSTGSKFQTATRVDDGGTLIAGNATVANVAGVAAATITTATEIVVDVDGTETQITTTAATDTVSSVATSINGVAGVSASEEISFSISDYATANDTTGTLTIGDGTNTVDIVLEADNLVNTDPSDVAGTAKDRLASLLDKLQNVDLSSLNAGGGSVTLTAELNAAGNGIDVRINNTTTGNVQFSTDAATTTLTTTIGGTGGTVDDTADIVSGRLRVTSDDPTKDVNIAIAEQGAAGGANLLVAAGNDTFKITGSNPNGTSSALNTSVKLGGKDVPSTALPAGSTVADLASNLNGLSGVKAWEEVTFTLKTSDTSLTVGDTLTLGQADGGTTVGVAITADKADGATYAGKLVDDINDTDFSSTNMDVSAVKDANGNVKVTVRNFSSSDVGISSTGAFRRAGIDADNDNTTDARTSVNERKLSGELKFMSEDDRALEVTVSDGTSGGEIFSGTSTSKTYSGVNGLQDGDLLINGVTIGGADVGSDKASATVSSDGSKILSSEKSLSAIAVASAINKVSEETGVSAEVNATSVVGGDGSAINATSLAQFEQGDQASIYVNGVEVGTVTLQNDGGGKLDTDRARADALNIINQNAGKTGVTAVDNGVSLTLTAADGRNVSVAIDDKAGADASIGALFGLDAGVDGIGESTFGKKSANGAVTAEAATYETTYGTVKLNSAKEFSLSGGANGNDELSALGLAAGTYGGGKDGQFLKDVDISTFEGAQTALTAIDNAIAQVASQRADLGAIQNRMESTVKNLQVTSENLNAANSRIRDADFAAETAELQRTNVLQQAGISVLAQANASGQNVLSLLG